MPAGRRGRPYQIPEDKTPIGGAAADVDARVGWMLLMSRLHHDDHELALGESFNNALRAVGLHADRSAVSRWESGKVTPRYSVLLAYEQALRLPRGQLTSVVNALRREFNGSGLASWTPILDPNSVGFHARLDKLFDTVVDGPATGHEWTALAQHVSAAGTMYVPGRVWQSLSRSLVSETARSVRVAYLQRYEAVRLLLEHRVAKPWLASAVEAYLDDPGVQVVSDPMSIHEVSRTRQAADLLLNRFLGATNAQMLTAATEAVSTKLRAGDYPAEQIAAIEQRVLSLVEGGNPVLALFEQLIPAMPEPSRSRLIRASREALGHDPVAPSVAHGELLSGDVARRVSQRIAESVRKQLPASNLYDEDRMTPRLIREALFSARPNVRHYASLALLGSPFRTPVTEALIAEVDEYGLNEPLTLYFAGLLRYLASSEHEETVVGWLPSAPNPIARELALTLGHLSSDRPLDKVTKMLGTGGPGLDRAILYCLGMRRSEALTELANKETYDAEMRVAARWWIRQGGVIHV